MRKVKKLSSNENLQDRKKLRRKIIIRSVLLVAFLLGINTFAWFTYISRAGVTLNASVVNWDVLFQDETNAIKDIHIEITDMKPGMLTYEKQIEITNHGDIDAKMGYIIKNATLLGKDIFQNKDTEQFLQQLANEYPFKLSLVTDKNLIVVGDTAHFSIQLDWEYEGNEYYKVNNLYTYDPSVYYYTLVGDTYEVDNTVTVDNFNEKIQSGIYLEKDDADSYFGYACGQYENSTGKPCLDLNVELNVTQIN